MRPGGRAVQRKCEVSSGASAVDRDQFTAQRHAEGRRLHNVSTTAHRASGPMAASPLLFHRSPHQ